MVCRVVQRKNATTVPAPAFPPPGGTRPRMPSLPHRSSSLFPARRDAPERAARPARRTPGPPRQPGILPRHGGEGGSGPAASPKGFPPQRGGTPQNTPPLAIGIQRGGGTPPPGTTLANGRPSRVRERPTRSEGPPQGGFSRPPGRIVMMGTPSPTSTRTGARICFSEQHEIYDFCAGITLRGVRARPASDPERSEGVSARGGGKGSRRTPPRSEPPPCARAGTEGRGSSFHSAGAVSLRGWESRRPRPRCRGPEIRLPARAGKPVTPPQSSPSMKPPSRAGGKASSMSWFSVDLLAASPRGKALRNRTSRFPL